jgi:hypothetical protein
MDDRILLEHLIARVEPRIRDVSRRLKNTSRDIALSGRGHWWTAVHNAKEALASKDPERIKLAAQLCPTYERTGNELAQVHSRKMTATAGGQARSATRIRERDARKPYVEEYWRLRGEGKSAPMARAAAMKLLEADVKSGKRFPGLKGLLPDARTARKWFPSK